MNVRRAHPKHKVGSEGLPSHKVREFKVQMTRHDSTPYDWSPVTTEEDKRTGGASCNSTVRENLIRLNLYYGVLLLIFRCLTCIALYSLVEVLHAWLGTVSEEEVNW